MIGAAHPRSASVSTVYNNSRNSVDREGTQRSGGGSSGGFFGGLFGGGRGDDEPEWDAGPKPPQGAMRPWPA